MLKEIEKTDLDTFLLFRTWFFGMLGFNEQNESLRQRDEEVLIPYTQHRLNGEKVLRTVIDNINVPYG